MTPDIVEINHRYKEVMTELRCPHCERGIQMEKRNCGRGVTQYECGCGYVEPYGNRMHRAIAQMLTEEHYPQRK